MRAIHLVRPSPGSSQLEPLCGVWGPTDTHWTEDTAGVTCGACLEALRHAVAGGPRHLAAATG